MIEVIVVTALMISLGVLWRVAQPQGIDADSLRLHLTGLVYNLLLPSLVLDVLWRADLSFDSFKIIISAVTAVSVGMLFAWLWFRRRLSSHQTMLGALILAAGFPNATYMGLPVLESLFGESARAIAIQYDLLACTPILLSVGVVIAAHYGHYPGSLNISQKLLRIPPLWAAIAGVCLNLFAIPQEEILHRVMSMLGGSVVPLMLISLGLSLRWSDKWLHQIKLVLPIVIIQLLLTPWIISGLTSLMLMEGDIRLAVILEAAMPSMVLGIVLCDRYKLDSSLYAMAVTFTTLISLLTLPFWLYIYQ
jgi:hypothetical protein